MAAAGTQNVLQINKSYLNNLKGQLQTILDAVNAQLAGVGDPSNSKYDDEAFWTNGSTLNIPAVNQALQVEAGVEGSNGQGGFDPAVQLNTALANMGGSVYSQLTWLKQVLTAMESEIDQTAQSFSQTETLNGESVTQLQDEFSNTISSLQQGPESNSGTSSSGSTSSGSTSNGSTSSGPPSSG